MSKLALKNLLVPSKSVDVEYPGMPGFTVSLSFLSRETIQNIKKKATKQTYKGRIMHEETDDELFLSLYVAACVKGWLGLKLAYLEQLAPVELGDNNADDELEYSEENALFLMKNSTNFDSFVSEQVTDLGNFSKNKSSK